MSPAQKTTKSYGVKPKRSYKKKQSAKRYRPVSNIGSALQPFPAQQIVKMKYCEALALTISTNPSAVYRYNLNSIFDPNLTGVGHQPYGHDTLATLYNRYRVIGCSWNISINPYSSALQLVAQPSNEILYSTATLCSEARENPRSKFIIQMPGGGNKVLSGYTSIPSLVGRTKSQYMADDRYQAIFSTSPNEVCVLNMLVGFLDESVASNNVSLNVTLEYTVEVFDPKHLTQS